MGATANLTDLPLPSWDVSVHIVGTAPNGDTEDLTFHGTVEAWTFERAKELAYESAMLSLQTRYRACTDAKRMDVRCVDPCYTRHVGAPIGLDLFGIRYGGGERISVFDLADFRYITDRALLVRFPQAAVPPAWAVLANGTRAAAPHQVLEYWRRCEYAVSADPHPGQFARHYLKALEAAGAVSYRLLATPLRDRPRSEEVAAILTADGTLLGFLMPLRGSDPDPNDDDCNPNPQGE